MSVVLKINSVDKSSDVDWKTLRVERLLTSQIDTLNFTIKLYEGKTYKPDLLDDVELLDNGTKIFGGKIVGYEDTIDAKVQKIQIVCKDHSHEMDSVLVVKTYESTTVDAILADIVATFLPAGFTLNTSVTLPVEFIAFNYAQPTKAIQQLAELVAGDWYVDVNKQIQFFTKGDFSAPFEINDTSNKFIWNSLVVKKDVKNLRNTIFVRGGTFSGSSFVEEQEADGVTETFTFGFRYKNVQWEVDRGSGFSAETFGIDNITDPTTVDWLYNFQEKAMKRASATIPSATHKIRITGLPQIPVITKSKDNVSVTTYGEFEHKIVDKSIDSKGGAKDRANADLVAWKDEINEGSFRTRESGLEVGQTIRVNSVSRGIDETFLISRISSRLDTPTSLIHTCTLVTMRNWGVIEYLQKQLTDKDKEIEIDPDEVLDKIENAFETITLGEAFATSTDHNKQLETITLGELATATKNAGTVFVYGPFSPPVPPKYVGLYDRSVYS